MAIWFNIALTASACSIEAAFGYPEPVFRASRHPVVWMGALLLWLERRLNPQHWAAAFRRAGGVAALAALLLAVCGPAWTLQWAVGQSMAGLVLLAVVASALLAQRSLWTHVSAVAEGLGAEGLAGGRLAVSRIVGRDPERLDEAGVARAAIESLAENFSDGVVAPAFWGVVAGLPGMAGYKAINTADSMVGHRTPRHEAFGWASARLDDLVNLPASRLSALWLIVAAWLGGADPAGAWRAVRHDARRHRSPNAGWPEAAMAGALGLRLAGPRVYCGVLVEDAWMGDGRAATTPDDVHRALHLYRIACAVQLAALAALLLLIGLG